MLAKGLYAHNLSHVVLPLAVIVMNNITQLLHWPSSSVLIICFFFFNEMMPGQVVTFPQTNYKIAVSSEIFHSGRQRVGKVSSVVNWVAMNKCFVIESILFIIVFCAVLQRGLCPLLFIEVF